MGQASVTPEGKFILLDGLRFHYLDWGGEGPPLVCLHGAGGNASNWAVLAEGLGQHVRVLGLDMRSHGDTEARGLEYLPRLAEDLLLFAEAMAVGRFHLIGHSLGARVAAMFAATYSDHVDQLILSDPPHYPMEDELAREWADLERRPEAFADERSLLGAMIETIGVMEPYWPRITSPTLLLHGTRSEALSSEAARQTIAAVQSGTLVDIEAGHGIWRENPEAALNAVRAFLTIPGVTPS